MIFDEWWDIKIWFFLKYDNFFDLLVNVGNNSECFILNILYEV